MLKSSEASTVSRATAKHGLQLLISSRDAAALNHLKTVSQRLSSLQVSTRLVSNGHTDPLYGQERMPDFLLLRVSHLWREELAAFRAWREAQAPEVLQLIEQLPVDEQ